MPNCNQGKPRVLTLPEFGNVLLADSMNVTKKNDFKTASYWETGIALLEMNHIRTLLDHMD
jgi:hypothetical protein